MDILDLLLRLHRYHRKPDGNERVLRMSFLELIDVELVEYVRPRSEEGGEVWERGWVRGGSGR